MPAKVTYGFSIRITHIMDRHLKCSEPAVDYGTWCMCECLTTRRGIPAWMFDDRFVQASGAPIVQ